jgi:cytochrome P450
MLNQLCVSESYLLVVPMFINGIRYRIGFSWHFAFMLYGQSWKDHRKTFHQELNLAGVIRYRPHILVATRKFLRANLQSPDDFMAHLH